MKLLSLSQVSIWNPSSELKCISLWISWIEIRLIYIQRDLAVSYKRWSLGEVSFSSELLLISCSFFTRRKLVASIRVTCSHVEKLVLCKNAFAFIISCLDSAYSYTKRSSRELWKMILWRVELFMLITPYFVFFFHPQKTDSFL